MASRQGAFDSPTLMVGPTSGMLFKPDEVFEEVVNAYPTEEGSYRSIYKPVPYLPAAGGGAPPSGSVADNDPLTYGPVHGIHHAFLKGGQREVLLLHTGDQLWEMRHHERAWYPLISSTAFAAQMAWQQFEAQAAPWPTQFVTTPTGVVIVPYGARAYFYDGDVVGELGFAEPPAPPTGLGPESNTGAWNAASNLGGVNDAGFSQHGLVGRPGAMDEHIGGPRIGSVFSPSNIDATVGDESHVSGYLLPGRWRCSAQYIDIWGNLSPLSGESNDIVCVRQPAQYYVPVFTTSRWYDVNRARRQFGWEGISTGPQHTAGRILYRTKDLENSGDTQMYELPVNGQAIPGAIATMPDRQSTFYPDNVPDAWLVSPPLLVDPVPEFRLIEMAFGRVWIANSLGDEGMVQASEIGIWGTFLSRLKYYPDPRAAGVTGLKAVDAGLLVFTERSTFLFTQNDAGDGFRFQTLSTTVGCVAPSSIATTRDGETFWLSRDGFSRYRDGVVEYAFGEHRFQGKRINSAWAGRSVATFDPESGQYHCWVPHEGSTVPNRRYKYSKLTGWHWDDYDGTVSMHGVTVTSDHRSMQIGAGTVGSDTGVWAMDRGGDVQEMRVKTGWIRAMRSVEKGSIQRVRIWVRETNSSGGSTAEQIQVKVRRNWRAEVVDTFTREAYPDIHSTRQSYEPEPTFWPATIGASTAKVRRRRPFWISVDVNLQHTEVFSLEVSSTNRLEIVGVVVTEKPSTDGGASNRR